MAWASQRRGEVGEGFDQLVLGEAVLFGQPEVADELLGHWGVPSFQWDALTWCRSPRRSRWGRR